MSAFKFCPIDSFKDFLKLNQTAQSPVLQN